MKVIFLDLVGVMLCRHDSAQRAIGPILMDGHHEMQWIHPEKIEALNAILDATGAFIVITSTLRREYMIGAIKHFFEEYGVRKGRIIYQTRVLNSNDREEEIQDWIDTTGKSKGLESFIVLDDEKRARFWARQVRPNEYYGLTKDYVEEAVELLA